MTDAALQQHQARRTSQSARFRDKPELWKVCDACLSIVLREAHICRYCGAYRWDESPARIRKIACLMQKNPFPVNAGTVPRLATV
jgi:hypothetical protein